ncbi:MAG: DnaB-like helicase C-terminal domain-containing protein, partial [Eubacterium sp.]|nr:DnaB-like helicase C-terminal domain-containing protein [Eubacterium sp.]
LNIAHHVAVKERVPVAMFSLEMTSEQLVMRLVALDSMVEAKKLKTGDISDKDWSNIIESTDILSRSPIFIDDNSSITISELRTECRKLKQTKNIGLIVIDYLQLMNSSGHVESRQQFISEVSRALKSLAKELNVPVLALSQLNRAVDSRPDHRPVLADLRESGAIEQDADVVMFIYRDEYYNKEKSEKKGVAEIIIAKQRNGSTGPVDLAWLGTYTKFASINKDDFGQAGDGGASPSAGGGSVGGGASPSAGGSSGGGVPAGGGAGASGNGVADPSNGTGAGQSGNTAAASDSYDDSGDERDDFYEDYDDEDRDDMDEDYDPELERPDYDDSES